MGKFARVLAHGKNIVVDPIATGGKYVGRKTKQGVVAAKNGIQSGAQAVLVEEANIEQMKVAKAEAKERAEQVVTKATTPTAKAKPKPRVQPTKRTTAKASSA